MCGAHMQRIFPQNPVSQDHHPHCGCFSNGVVDNTCWHRRNKRQSVKMPRCRKGWVDWKKLKAKKILMEDLENEVLPLSEEEMLAANCWKTHQQFSEFGEIQFNCFEERLAGHRQVVEHQKTVLHCDEEFFLHDQMLCPQKTTNQRVEPKFHLSPACALLK